MIYWICDVMTSISTWDRVHIFWTTAHKVTKLSQLIDINKSNNFQESLNNLEDWGYVPGHFQFSNLLKLLNNQLCQDNSVSPIWKWEYGTIKMANVIY